MVSWNSINPCTWSKLEQNRDKQWCRSDNEASSPFSFCKWYASSDGVEDVGEDVLEGECNHQDTEEEFVVEEVLDDIEISFSNFSAVDVVEDLEEDEGVKDPSEMFKLFLAIVVSFNSSVKFFLSCLEIFQFLVRSLWVQSTWMCSACWCIGFVVKITHGLSEEHENNHDDCVPGRNTDDLSPDSFAQNWVFGIDGFTLDDVLEWWLSRQSKSGEDVHDQVDPQELD